MKVYEYVVGLKPTDDENGEILGSAYIYARDENHARAIAIVETGVTDEQLARVAVYVRPF